MSVTISETSEGKRRGNPDWLPVMSYDEARKVVSKKGFKNLVAPVRPNQKSNYPLISIDDYITWKTDQDLPFDAWPQ